MRVNTQLQALFIAAAMLAFAAASYAAPFHSIVGGSGGGSFGFVGLEQRFGRHAPGGLYLRECVGASYLEEKAVLSPNLTLGWSLVNEERLKLGLCLSAGSYLLFSPAFDYSPSLAAGLEFSFLNFFAGCEYAGELRTGDAPTFEFHPQARIGLRFRLGPPQAPPLAITSPKIKAGVKFTTKAASITVSGKLSDAAQVKEVWIQGKKAPIAKNGTVSTSMKLAVGENKILIRVVYKNGEKREMRMLVVRSGKS